MTQNSALSQNWIRCTGCTPNGPWLCAHYARTVPMPRARRALGRVVARTGFVSWPCPGRVAAYGLQYRRRVAARTLLRRSSPRSRNKIVSQHNFLLRVLPSAVSRALPSAVSRALPSVVSSALPRVSQGVGHHIAAYIAAPIPTNRLPQIHDANHYIATYP